MPIIIPDKKLLFLHIPKTGGNWIRKVLVDLEITHTIIDDTEEWKYHQHLHPSYLRFSVVRNPITWYPSYWANASIFGPDGLGKFAISRNFRETDSFAEFMESVLEEHPGYLTHLYSKYIAPKAIVLQMERIVLEFAYLLDIAATKLQHIEPQNRCASRPEYQDKVQMTKKITQGVILSEAKLFERYWWDIP